MSAPTPVALCVSCTHPIGEGRRAAGYRTCSACDPAIRRMITRRRLS